MKHVANGNTQRVFLKGTAVVLAVLLMLTFHQSAAQTTPPVVPPSPPTTPWQELLDNAITHLDPVNALYSAPTADAKATTGTWTSASVLAMPEQIVATINPVDRVRGHPRHW